MTTWRKGLTGIEVQVFQPSKERKRPINRVPLGRIIPRRTRVTLEFYLFDPEEIESLRSK